MTGTCPELPAPTDPIIDALEEVAMSDPESEEWVKDLDRHYEDLDVCSALLAQ